MNEALEDAIEAASEDDRLWFEAHPRRRHRVRPYIPGEWPEEYSLPAPPSGRRWFTAVRQVQPGVRVRLAFYAAGEPVPGEHAAGRLFAFCINASRDAATVSDEREAPCRH